MWIENTSFTGVVWKCSGFRNESISQRLLHQTAKVSFFLHVQEDAIVAREHTGRRRRLWCHKHVDSLCNRSHCQKGEIRVKKKSNYLSIYLKRTWNNLILPNVVTDLCLVLTNTFALSRRRSDINSFYVYLILKQKRRLVNNKPTTVTIAQTLTSGYYIHNFIRIETLLFDTFRFIVPGVNRQRSA